MASIHPTKIPGRWREGFALDYHTVSSEFIGHDEYGHPRFETRRSELGELLYRLKYSSDRNVVGEIAETAGRFLKAWHPEVGLLVPVPASRARPGQPVLLLAEALGKWLNLPVCSAVTRVKSVPELKDVFEYGARVKLLEGAHNVDPTATEGQTVLLFDDLFRSGATMNAVTDIIYGSGKARDVYALTVTRTRIRS